MQDGPDLLQEFTIPPEAAQATTMIVALEGFMDAGKAAGGAVDTLKEFLTHRTVAGFDTDQLIDYRSRRPPMSFTGRRFNHVTWPELEVLMLFDERDQPFYLLTGPEPDFQWRRFVVAVERLITDLGVTLVVTGQGVPWAAPHTRPLRRLTHASRDELIGDRATWIQQMQVPGYAAAILERRLAATGVDTISQSVQVPHYLTDLTFPTASVSLLDGWADVTGLTLPHGQLEDLGLAVMAQVEQQTRSSAELTHAVSDLERAYDNDLTHQAGSLWTDSDIGDQVEQFLRDLDDGRPPQP